jgi:hypothetical protein
MVPAILIRANTFVFYMLGNQTSATEKNSYYEEQREKKVNDPLFVALVAKIFPSKSIFSLIASWKELERRKEEHEKKRKGSGFVSLKQNKIVC